jgi:hypothetical protein
MAADTRGPHSLGLISSLLDRRHTACIGLWGPGSTALGRHNREMAADTQGPHSYGLISSLLDRRRTAIQCYHLFLNYHLLIQKESLYILYKRMVLGLRGIIIISSGFHPITDRAMQRLKGMFL